MRSVAGAGPSCLCLACWITISSFEKCPQPRVALSNLLVHIKKPTFLGIVILGEGMLLFARVQLVVGVNGIGQLQKWSILSCSTNPPHSVQLPANPIRRVSLVCTHNDNPTDKEDRERYETRTHSVRSRPTDCKGKSIQPMQESEHVDRHCRVHAHAIGLT